MKVKWSRWADADKGVSGVLTFSNPMLLKGVLFKAL